MAVYAKKINGAQRKCMAEYESISGFEFMHQNDIDSGEMTFEDAWEINIRWLEGILAGVTNISTAGALKP